MNVALDHPKEREAYRLGEKMFYFRGGTHDFACATCHGEDGKRIRLQDLPNLANRRRQKAYTTWPAYRVSQGELRSFQWRLNCFRQQRFPELIFFRRFDRVDHVPCTQRERRCSMRLRSSADERRRHATPTRDTRPRRRRRCRSHPDRLRHRSGDAEVNAKAAAVLGASFRSKDRRSSIAWCRTTRRRPAAPMPARHCRRTSRSGRKAISRRSMARRRAQATGRTARGSRRKDAACSIRTIPEAGRRQLLCLPRLSPGELSCGTIPTYQFGSCEATA